MALNKHNQLGLTLLEVLVAITLMVIISAVSFISLNGLIDAKNQTDQVAQNLRNELLTSQQLNKDMAAMIDRSIKGELSSYMPALVGGYTNFEFSRNGHANVLNQNSSDLQRVQWYLRDGKLYRRALNHLDRGSFPRWQEHEYLNKIQKLTISYVNSVGLESSIWPIPDNPNLQLKSIKMSIEMENDSVLNYQWYLLL